MGVNMNFYSQYFIGLLDRSCREIENFSANLTKLFVFGKGFENTETKGLFNT
jgi:hypothetical protein